MSYFKKIFYLPSGGLSYSPFVWIYPVTNEIQLFQNDPNNGDSLLEYELSIIEKYTETEINILDLYAQDMNYLWMYFLISEFISTGSYYIDAECNNCGKKNTLFLDLSKFNVNVHNAFIKPLSKQFIFENEKGKMVFGRRTLRQCIEFGNTLLNTEDDDEDTTISFTKKIAFYMATQLDELIFKDAVIPKHEYVNFFLSMPLKDSFEVYKKLEKFENEIGLENSILYECPECKTQQEGQLFSNMMASIMRSSKDKELLNRQKTTFDHLFSISRLPAMKYQELLNTPIRLTEQLTKALGDIQWGTGIVV